MIDQTPEGLLKRMVWTTQVPTLLTSGDINELHKKSEAITNLAMLEVILIQ
jgi:hypothetical protein